MARTTLNSTSLLALLRGPSTLTAATFVASLALVACGDETQEKTGGTGPACDLFTGEGCEDTSADTTADTSTDTGTADTTEEDTNVEDTEVDTAVEDTTVDTGPDTGGIQESCGNGTDDDGDGNADCADTDCANNAACLECDTLNARDCEPDNRACDVAAGPDSCGDCLDTFVDQGGTCICDATICDAAPAPFCRGNNRVETARTAYDVGTSCECRDAESVTACPTGTNCDAGECVAVPVTQDPWILFVRTPGSACAEQQASQLYVVRADGTDERRVTNLPGQKLAARWSPDGRSVYFSMKVTDCSAPANTNVGIYKLTLETGAIDQITPVCPELAYQGNPDPTGLLSGGFTVLADESALVFTNFYDGDFGLFTQPLDASGASCTVLVDNGGNGEADPAIAECDPSTVIYTKQAAGGSVTLFSVGTDGTGNGTASLTGYLGAPAISPAGTSALWTKDLGGGATQLYSNAFNCTTHRTSGTPTPVSGSTNDSSPAFFPNGNLVTSERIFASASVVQTEIMVLNITTGLTTRITTNEVLDGGPRPGLIEATTLNPAIAR
jgi:Tol biopolymer transport system component